jgi:hypothetical protein
MKKTLAFALLAAILFVPRNASALENEDVLALVAMPLAVAAVSEMADVPMNEVMNVVTLLNDAAVPPPQFIEVVRYVPVALHEDTDTNFVEFIQLREEEGLRGTQLVTAIEHHLRDDIPAIDLDVARPRVDIEEDFVFVRDERTSHPHGGPPGQLKKVAGVQTGAEIVHGITRGRGVRSDKDRARVTVQDRDNRGNCGGGKGHDRGNGGDGHGGGNGKGKGKGKG